MDNVKYYNRFLEKTQTMNMKKVEMIVLHPNTTFKFQTQFQKSWHCWKKFVKKILKNIMSLILWLKKLAALCATVASISLHIEFHRNGVELIKILCLSLEYLYKSAIKNCEFNPENM